MQGWDLIRETEWCARIGISTRTARRWESVGIIRPPTRIAGQRWRRADERPLADHERPRAAA